MDRAVSFHFTDEQWHAISVEFDAIGRPREPSRRWLEFLCNAFVRQRPIRGRGLPTPAKARKAWLEVGKAAARLDDAIKALRPAGAADFTMLDDHHRGGMEAWAAQLPEIAAAAEQAAKLEQWLPSTTGEPNVKVPPNNTDPLLDGLVRHLVRLWEEWGGERAIGYDDAKGAPCGPLFRFLNAVIAPTLVAANEEPISPDALRGKVRSMAS